MRWENRTRWRGKSPTPAQIKLLSRFKEVDIMPSTRSEATKLIEKLLAKHRR